MNTYIDYKKNTAMLTSSVQKLSSGCAINSAADDAAGLAISEKMRAQIRGLDVAKSNAQGAVSLLQTADGSLGSINEILQRMRELAVQSSSGTNDDKTDRSALQDEYSQLQAEIDDIANTTTYNAKNLLDGSISAAKERLSDTGELNDGVTDTLDSTLINNYKTGSSYGLVIQIGANQGDEKTISLGRTDIANLGLSGSDVSTQEGASSSIGALDTALEQVSSQRSYLGAQITSFEDIANTDTQALSAAESRIIDVDIAKEMIKFTNAAVLQQVDIAIMAHANAVPETVLTLISSYRSA